MLTGLYRYSNSMTISMKHPWKSSLVIIAIYSGETLRGVPSGLGEFTSGDLRGFGYFKDGQLHGRAITLMRDGVRRQCEYREGVCDGFGRGYYKEALLGKMGANESADLSGWAYYVGWMRDW